VAAIEVRFLGSGDAFGSGGRFHTCLLVAADPGQFLIDCGASSATALHRYGVDPNAIDAILLSHLHGDHFGGVPFFVLDAHHVGKRTRPLVVAGPPGTAKRLGEAMEVLFPGSTAVPLRFALETVELEPEQPRQLGEIRVTPYVVRHPCGAPPFALRIECQGRVIAFSGDTEWTDALIPAARGADLFISECNAYEQKIRFHMDLGTLWAHRDRLQVKRLIVTHMGPEVLAHLASLPCEHAEDGKVVTL
jgi:ribonuclease BN (tRNA processing enzyme)